MESNQELPFLKEQITQAFIKLLKEYSYEDISITDIVKQAGVGRSSFYRNYTDKLDILRQYLDVLVIEWRNEFRYVNINKAHFIKSIFQHYEKHKDIYLLLYKHNKSYLILENIKSICGPFDGQSALDTYSTAFLSYGLFGWIDEWFARNMKETSNEMVDLYIKAQNQEIS